MNGLETPVVMWSLLAVQLFGLASAWVTRLTEGSRLQSPSQWTFLACLALVGASTMVATTVGPGCLLMAGTTLALMVLAATCDFRHSVQAA